jgi:peptidoglycan/LPS O-acetylase OafA/YrhL
MGLLRVLLALAVVFAHSPWHSQFVLVGGRNAVQLFYMISGFLMSHILVTLNKYPQPMRFYASRWLRIYPLYYVVAFLALLAAFLPGSTFFDTYRAIPLSAAIFLILANILIFGQDWIMFSGLKDGRLAFTADFHKSSPPLYKGLLIEQAWTLGVELTFYLLAPFILRNRKMIWSLLIGSILVRVLLFKAGLGREDPWTYRFFPSELVFFLAGALSNQIMLPWWNGILKKSSRIPEIFSYGLAVFVVLYFVIPVSTAIKVPLLFLAAAGGLPLAFMHQDRSRFDRRLGELSYPIYIGHMLTIDLLDSAIGNVGAYDPLLISLAHVGVAVIFAVLLNKYVGRRIETFRARTVSGTTASGRPPQAA